jgi:hypothetical protein
MSCSIYDYNASSWCCHGGPSVLQKHTLFLKAITYKSNGHNIREPDIQRCSAVQTDRNLYKRLWDKVNVLYMHTCKAIKYKYLCALFLFNYEHEQVQGKKGVSNPVATSNPLAMHLPQWKEMVSI